MPKIQSMAKNMVKSIDLFPRPISLTYQGKENFKSLYGGIVSTFLIALLISYGILIAIPMLKHTASSKAKNHVLRDQSSEVDKYQTTEKDFSFVVQIVNSETRIALTDPSYFNISISQSDFSFNKTIAQFQETNIEKEISICGEKFPKVNEYIDETSSILKGISYCPHDYDFLVAGDVFASVSQSIKITVSRCVNGTSIICKSMKEINEKASLMSVNVLFISQYFDSDNYKTPIKSFLDNRYSLKMAAGFKKTSNLFLRKSKTSRTDSIFPFAGDGEDEFYSVGNSQFDFGVEQESENILAKYTIYQDRVQDVYERRVYSLLDFFGQLGGFFEILTLAGTFLVHYFADKIYRYSLFTELYCVDSDEIELRKVNSKVASKSPKHLNYTREISKTKHDTNNNDKDKSEIKERASRNYRKHSLKNASVVDKVKSKIISKSRFHYTANDYFKSCLPFIKSNTSRQFDFLNHRLSQECDLPSILCAIRQLRRLVSSTLSNHQRLMLSFCSQNSMFSKPEDSQPLQPADFAVAGQPNSSKVKAVIETLETMIENMEEQQLQRDAETILGITISSSNNTDEERVSIIKEGENSNIGLVDQEEDRKDNCEDFVCQYVDP
ncbi:unnamed protein product [Moneuplotes crassus]|uniref:Uncharacterized protein n=1 Tax=Euplotes crassus TaxID=5936 RepID=A0AAD1U3V1_EUPCR|nr:unnamed protein product [Moneuplotes crassus]